MLRLSARAGSRAILVALLAAPVLAFGYSNPGTPQGFVNDFANIISADTRAALESELAVFEQETTNEITVVTVPDLGGDTVENFAVKLFEDWQIGKEGRDNGILFLVARDDRKMRIEVGYGLEGALPDAISSQIIREIVTPAFKSGDYDGGISKAVNAMEQATRGEFVAGSSENSSGKLRVDFVGLFFLVFFLLRILMLVLARTPSWWAGGVLGALAGGGVGLFAGFLYTGLVSMAVFIPLGLWADFLLSRSYKAHKAGGAMPWWLISGHRSGSGHSSSGSGGFGGFGGGHSGGGGSSGGW